MQCMPIAVGLYVVVMSYRATIHSIAPQNCACDMSPSKFKGARQGLIDFFGEEGMQLRMS